MSWRFPIVVFSLSAPTSIWALLAILIGILMGAIALRAEKYGFAAIAFFLMFSVFTWGATASNIQQARLASFHVATPTQRVKKQYVEWYAAMGWSRPARKQFATGVGAGNYQFNVGSYYGGLPNEAKMPPDSNNLYLVQMVSLGALGLGALLWVLAHFMKIAWRAARWKSTASTRTSRRGAGRGNFFRTFRVSRSSTSFMPASCAA